MELKPLHHPTHREPTEPTPTPEPLRREAHPRLDQGLPQLGLVLSASAPHPVLSVAQDWSWGLR